MGKKYHASIGKVQDDKPRQDMGGGEMYITVEEVTATLHPENGEVFILSDGCRKNC